MKFEWHFFTCSFTNFLLLFSGKYRHGFLQLLGEVASKWASVDEVTIRLFLLLSHEIILIHWTIISCHGRKIKYGALDFGMIGAVAIYGIWGTFDKNSIDGDYRRSSLNVKSPALHLSLIIIHVNRRSDVADTMKSRYVKCVAKFWNILCLVGMSSLQFSSWGLWRRHSDNKMQETLNDWFYQQSYNRFVCLLKYCTRFIEFHTTKSWETPFSCMV